MLAGGTLWQLDAAPGSVGSYVCVNWKALVLLATGFLGGIFSPRCARRLLHELGAQCVRAVSLRMRALRYE